MFCKYYSEFYKRSLYHALVSAIGVVLFALGLEYSRGEKGTHRTPYYIPAIVLAALHFVQMLASLMLYSYVSKRSIHHTCINGMKSVYRFLAFAEIPWSAIGASLAGTSGICAGPNSCYYVENVAKNRIICIFIIVVHVLNFVASFLLIKISEKEFRVKASSENVTGSEGVFKIDSDSNNVTKIRPDNVEAMAQGKQQQAQDAMRDKHLRQWSFLNKRDSEYNREQFYDDRSSRSPTGGVDESEVHSELPKNNKRLKLKTLGHIATKFGGVQQTQDVYTNKHVKRSASDTSSSSDGDNINTASTIIKQNQRLTNNGVQTQVDELPNTFKLLLPYPRGPPPSYNDVVFPSRQNPEMRPYLILPLPRHESTMRKAVPENIYSGSSLPDTELVTVQPADE